ncbi:hypothetical protein ABFS82_13G108200 [Erythranthe guttata]|uniref:Tetraspanin-19-like n=1 Tax=Erythranthe guttata TaxID=4155 RepID=A0A022QK79_ERYGU|nr:PREDICTED: tetraspanin-19-like [Erythranthe guttata]EYU27959.1 hypothetical protein MIMGU_mgv1a014133mg [Erythranthe guttata]|eukprot:XP_012849091.1 PREDICTED: tetraspanin-19-like [Erythranthe guttata]
MSDLVNVKKWLKSSLKLLNFSVGVGGIALIVFGISTVRVLQPHRKDDSSSHHLYFPWFFYAFLGVGIALCAVTYLGYIASHTANFRCFYSYIYIVLLLLILELVITTKVFSDPNLKKELPAELSERFDEFNDFVHTWRWFVDSIYLIQGVCVFSVAILRTYHEIKVNSNVIEQVNEQPRYPLLDTLSQWRLTEPTRNLV